MENETGGCRIWFHADDYGVTAEQSRKILECRTEGALNSISIVPNSNELSESLAILNGVDPDAGIRRVLHINFVEGRPLAGAQNVPLLVDDTGFFDKSFIDFFKWNLTKQGKARAELKRQITLELRAQLREVTKAYDYGITAVDSHQHYHMIPIVFDSLIEILGEKEFEHLNIRHIRIPVDPVRPLLRAFGRIKGVRVLNLVKWCILKIYAGRNRKILLDKGIKSPVFFGIFYTCEMKWEVVKILLPIYKSYACQKRAELELMFHPGPLGNEQELLDIRKKELADFYMSDNRRREAECLKLIGHDRLS